MSWLPVLYLVIGLVMTDYESRKHSSGLMIVLLALLWPVTLIKKIWGKL